MEINLNIHRCTQTAESCPVVNQVIDIDVFCEQIGDVDPQALALREMLGDFVTACFNGACPAQHIQATTEALRQILRSDAPEKDA